METTKMVDAHTLDLLEFDKVRALVAHYGACSLGKELASQLEPGTDAQKIRAELRLVTEMIDAIGLGQAPPFGGLHDVRLVVRRAAIGALLTAEQLLEIAETLTCAGNMYRYRMRLDESCQQLINLLMPVEDLGPIAKIITNCIDGRGHVVDSASPELARIRGELTALDERVQQEIRRLLRDPKLREILRYPNATVNGDHYVLPVAVNHRQKVPGVVHRTSPTGETVFIEPSGIAHLSAERMVLKGEEDREIRRILRKLTAEVGKHSGRINIAVELLAKLDLITAKARYSRDFNHFAPEINDDNRLWLRSARHPLLEHFFRQPSSTEKTTELRQVVPIEVRLGIGFNMLVITGPNTGGKTVTIKTVGLLCIMAQAGIPIPASEGSTIPVFTRILADSGDEQSLEQSLSTFSSHISRIAYILREADEHSLVLLDEMGAGTDPTEGAALGRAILDALDEKRCRAMVTTHLGDLKTYAFTNERTENGAVEFDTESLRPTFKLLIGQFGMSNALKIARRLKLPKKLLERAHKYLRRRQRKAPELARLQQLREEAEKARSDALAARYAADQERAELLEQQRKLEKEAERESALKEFRNKLQPNDKVHVARFGSSGRIVRVDHKRNIALTSVGLGQWEIPFEELFPL
jgi:DNA mismatch repair protein MutS2